MDQLDCNKITDAVSEQNNKKRKYTDKKRKRLVFDKKIQKRKNKKIKKKQEPAPSNVQIKEKGLDFYENLQIKNRKMKKKKILKGRTQNIQELTNHN